MCDDINGLDFSLEGLPSDLLVSTENDILRDFGDSELDLDCLLNSHLIEEGTDQDHGNFVPVGRPCSAAVIEHDNLRHQSLIERVTTEVKQEPAASQNQSPVLESLLKSASVSTPCVTPAPPASITTFAPTISGRSQCASSTASPTPEPASNDNEAILSALLKRHEEDRRLLDHLVNAQRKKKERFITTPIPVPTSIVQKTVRSPPHISEQPTTVPAQVVVATPVTTRPVGIISGTRMFVTTPAMESSPAPDVAENMDIEDDYMYDDEPSRPKTKRRSSHNAIEKRYRLSINMRIDELRTLLDGPDSKLSKSAVLRRAIERIRNTERENALLRKELAALGATHRIENKPVTTGMKREFKLMDESESSPESINASITSPGSSLETSPPLSPQDHVLSGAGAKAPRLAHLLMKHESPNNTLFPGVASRARICLAGFFLTLFLVNPLALWNPSSASDSRFVSPGGAFAHTGRSLLNYWQKEPDSRFSGKWITLSLVSLLMGTAAAVWIITRKFRSAKTELTENGKDRQAATETLKVPDDIEFLIWRHWKQAEAHISETSWARVVTELKSVLIALGQPFPINRWDWFCFLPGQILCALGLTKDSTVGLKNDTAALRLRSLSKLLSLSLHGYVHLTFFQRISLAFGLWISMRRSRLTREERCQAFINLSFHIPLLRSRLRRYAADSLQTCDTNEVTCRHSWILNPVGFQFLHGYNFNSFTHKPIKPSEFDSDPGRIDLTEGTLLIAYAFRRKLMEEALELLANKDDQRLEEVLRLLTLLIDYSSNAELLETEEKSILERENGTDHVQHWWSNVGAVAVLWQQELWDKSRSFHAVVDSPPQSVKAISNVRSKTHDHNDENSSKEEQLADELAHAVLLSYRVQRRCVFGPCEVPRPCSHNALKLADEAAVILENSVLGKKAKEKAHWLWCALASDWLLTARLSLNQPPNSLGGADEEAQIHKFERDLSTLQGALKRAGMANTDAFRRWSVMHQARLRLWRGSHPVRTVLALRRDEASPKRYKDSEKENETSNEVAQVREWLQQRLMRPRSGMNGLK